MNNKIKVYVWANGLTIDEDQLREYLDLDDAMQFHGVGDDYVVEYHNI